MEAALATEATADVLGTAAMTTYGEACSLVLRARARATYAGSQAWLAPPARKTASVLDGLGASRRKIHHPLVRKAIYMAKLGH